MGSIVWATRSRRPGVVNWKEASPRSYPLSIHSGVNLDRVPRRCIGNAHLLSGKPTCAIDAACVSRAATGGCAKRSIARLAKQQAKEEVQGQAPAADWTEGKWSAANEADAVGGAEFWRRQRRRGIQALNYETEVPSRVRRQLRLFILHLDRNPGGPGTDNELRSGVWKGMGRIRPILLARLRRRRFRDLLHGSNRPRIDA